MDNSKVKKRGIVEMILAMLLMGTVGFFVLESGQSAYNIVFYRCLFGALFLAIYCYYFGFFKNTHLTIKSFLIIFLVMPLIG